MESQESSLIMYHLIVLIAGVVALIAGFRQGIVAQMASVLGFTCGTLVSYIFGPDMHQWVMQNFSFSTDEILNLHCCKIVGSGGIYLGVYFLFMFTIPIWQNIKHCFEASIVGSIVGSLFSLLKYMMVISISMNIVMAISGDRELLKRGSDDDGNLCALTLLLAPGIIGTQNVVDVANEIQRREARKISKIDNIVPLNCVYIDRTI